MNRQTHHHISPPNNWRNGNVRLPSKARAGGSEMQRRCMNHAPMPPRPHGAPAYTIIGLLRVQIIHRAARAIYMVLHKVCQKYKNNKEEWIDELIFVDDMSNLYTCWSVGWSPRHQLSRLTIHIYNLISMAWAILHTTLGLCSVIPIPFGLDVIEKIYEIF